MEKLSLSVRLGEVFIRLSFHGVEAIYLLKRASKKLRESLRKALVTSLSGSGLPRVGCRVGPAALLPSNLRSAAKSGCACSAERRGLRSLTVERLCVDLTLFTEEVLRKEKF